MSDQGKAAAQREPGLGTVVAASAAGTAFEWYDFFVFGSLATVIAKHFYAGVSEATGFILALATFAVGFFVRPLGALVFGVFGDKKGRKGAFLVTITAMGLATVAIGLLPDYGAIGMAAPIGLIVLRMIQGFALGGEYGGAAIYVAEHAPAHRRGFLTSFIQTSAALGLIGALLVILACRTIMGKEAFEEGWGWRIPFVLSSLLLLISLWIRVKLGESPAFKRMAEESAHHPRAPFAETFGRWRNLRKVFLVLFGVMIAQGAVWYCAFFYSQFFMQKILKLDEQVVLELMVGATAVSAVLYVFFGWLSDKIGRKPVMLFGMILAVAAFIPSFGNSAFHWLTRAGNPALAAAQASAPVTVTADPADCTLQFDPVGKATFASSCDIVKSYLTNAGVSYENRAAPAGSTASVSIGDVVVASRDGRGLDKDSLKAVRSGVESDVGAALRAAGYPEKADPARTDMKTMFLVMLVFTVAATALYGPQASALVELFPTRVRYTGMGVPYNIGTGWVGGFLPAAAFAIMAATGNIYAGLWYPVAFTVAAIVVAFLFLPETKGRDLNHVPE
ncbi:MAG: MFS transporter [Caulobacteraceae bacterium]|nr:MFS transporter [Caulobacteraceae bacterium]